MDKKVVTEIKKIISYVEEQSKAVFYLTWKEEGYTVSIQKKTKPESEALPLLISSETGDYIVENVRSLDNSFKVQDLLRELEAEGIY